MPTEGTRSNKKSLRAFNRSHPDWDALACDCVAFAKLPWAPNIWQGVTVEQGEAVPMCCGEMIFVEQHDENDLCTSGQRARRCGGMTPPVFTSSPVRYALL
jgi:hypothetical protein